MPRIYTYKITFEEVPYYYYGVHREKKFGEYYMGSPKTHRWCWEFYTPKKQILEIFPYTDEGWLEAQEVEKRLIQPVFNTDKWCLNENCGGIISLDTFKKGGQKLFELKLGTHSRTKEKQIEDGKKGGEKCYNLGIGIFKLTFEERSKNSKKVNAQKWICLETNYVSNSGGLSRYQKAKGIDTSKRKRIS